MDYFFAIYAFNFRGRKNVPEWENSFWGKNKRSGYAYLKELLLNFNTTFEYKQV